MFLVTQDKPQLHYNISVWRGTESLNHHILISPNNFGLSIQELY
jgi:hypothetical protein